MVLFAEECPLTLRKAFSIAYFQLSISREAKFRRSEQEYPRSPTWEQRCHWAMAPSNLYLVTRQKISAKISASDIHWRGAQIYIYSWLVMLWPPSHWILNNRYGPFVCSYQRPPSSSSSPALAFFRLVVLHRSSQCGAHFYLVLSSLHFKLKWPLHSFSRSQSTSPLDKKKRALTVRSPLFPFLFLFYCCYFFSQPTKTLWRFPTSSTHYTEAPVVFAGSGFHM